MRLNNTLRLATLSASALLLTSTAFAAGTVTSSFQVGIDVTSVCTINTPPVDVKLDSVQAGLGTTATTSSTTLTLNCSKGDVATIGLTPSSGSTDGTGIMKGANTNNTDTVPYKLTSGSANGSAWGTATTVSTDAAEQYSKAIDETIYVTLTNEADVLPDTYSDTVNISVTY